jgi:hypothetical protein
MNVATEIAAGGSDLGAIAAEVRRVALDLQNLLLQVGATDGIYVVVATTHGHWRQESSTGFR